MNWVPAFAHRRLARLSHYRTLTTSGSRLDADYVAAVPLRPDEQLLGVYEIEQNNRIGSIVVTDLGLYIAQDTGWKYIQYQDILRIEVPLPSHIPLPQRKVYADRITLKQHSGDIDELFIRGGQRASLDSDEYRTRDTWTIYQFLGRAIHDARSRHADNNHEQHS